MRITRETRLRHIVSKSGHFALVPRCHSFQMSILGCLVTSVPKSSLHFLNRLAQSCVTSPFCMTSCMCSSKMDVLTTLYRLHARVILCGHSGKAQHHIHPFHLRNHTRDQASTHCPHPPFLCECLAGTTFDCDVGCLATSAAKSWEQIAWHKFVFPLFRSA